MKKLGLYTALVAGMLASGQIKGGREKPKRPCLHCGTLHDHNNFCSATCCREYREGK